MRLWQILLLYLLICYGFGYLTARIYSKLKYRKLNKLIKKVYIGKITKQKGE